MGSVVKEVGNAVTAPLKQVGGYATTQLFGTNAGDQFKNTVSSIPGATFAGAVGNNISNIQNMVGGKKADQPSVYNSLGQPKPADIAFQSALIGGPGGYSATGGDMNELGSPTTQASAPLGSLASAYRLGTPDVKAANTSGLNEMKSLAGNGPDGFLSKQLAANDLNTQTLLDQNSKSSQDSFYNTLSNMAQTGGVSGAARERALANANKNAFASSMDIQRQGLQKGLDLQGTGLQKQFDMQNTIQNQDNQLYNADVQQQQMQQDANKFNITNTLNEIGNQRNFDLNKYQQDMAAWAANQSADVQSKYANQSKSGLLGLGFMGL